MARTKEICAIIAIYVKRKIKLKPCDLSSKTNEYKIVKHCNPCL